MASLDWRQGPLEDAGRGPQSRARLAAAVKRQKTELVSHVSDADDDDYYYYYDDDAVHPDDDDDDDDDDDAVHPDDDDDDDDKFRDQNSSRN